MNIPLDKLLMKMEAELHGAKNAQSDQVIRERIHSLKALCELVLDEPVTDRGQPKLEHREQRIQTSIQTPSPMPVSQPQTKRLEMEDGANGESLWDF